MLPVTVIGGYLGAGKTTLVNQMLRQADGTRLAVLVNEFGALPIDEDLIEASDDDLIAIAGGCICCSFGNDLIAALDRIAAFDPMPDHVVIEASGVALPGAIAGSVSLLDQVRLDGVCVLADALTLPTLARDVYIGDTIERQIADADLLILTKTDLVSEAALDAVRAWLSGTWPDVPLLSAVQGEVPNAVLLGQIATGRPRQGGQHADGLYASLVLRPAQPCDVAALAAQLSDPALGLARAKGYVDDLSGRRALVQLVGRRVDISFPAKTGAPGLVCIGLSAQLDREAVSALLVQA